MTSKEYRDALAKFELSQLAAARLFQLSPRQSRRYALNEQPVAPTVAALLRLMLDGKINIEDVERTIR